MSSSPAGPIRVGIIANPASGRDIRRLTSRASVFPNAEKASMIVRAIAGLEAAGVHEVLLMPDKGSISGLVYRTLGMSGPSTEGRGVRFLDMTISESIEDTLNATATMRAAGVTAIIVLGGDGTHRAVAQRCGPVPLLALSTGTNNAFPEMREATVAGLAAGFVASGAVPATAGLRRNKVLRIHCDGRDDIALVDACFTGHEYVGSRAVWDSARVEDLFVTFAAADSIGLSAIAGQLEPVSRLTPHGLHVRCAPAADTPRRVHAAIAPGLVAEVGVHEYGRLAPHEPVCISGRRGTIALDGEREIEFDTGSRVEVRLDLQGPLTIDVAATLNHAAQHRLLRGYVGGAA